MAEAWPTYSDEKSEADHFVPGKVVEAARTAFQKGDLTPRTARDYIPVRLYLAYQETENVSAACL
jgi:hypothetical protein